MICSAKVHLLRRRHADEQEFGPVEWRGQGGSAQINATLALDRSGAGKCGFGLIAQAFGVASVLVVFAVMALFAAFSAAGLDEVQSDS